MGNGSEKTEIETPMLLQVKYNSKPSVEAFSNSHLEIKEDTLESN